MFTRFMICIVLAAMALAAFAQPDPNNPGAGNKGGDVRNNPAREMMNYAYVNAMAQNPPTAIEATADGLFIYRNGVLALFANGKDTPKRLFELFEKMPELPKMDAPMDEKRAYMDALAIRVAPMVMIIDNKKVILASDTQIFAVDLASFKLISQVPLPAQAADPAGMNIAIMNGRVMGNNQTPPAIQVADNMVYLLRGNIMTTVDIQAGKVLSNNPLPLNMTPTQVPLNDWIRGLRDNQPKEFPAPPPAGGNQEPQPGAANIVTLIGVVRHVVNNNADIWTLEVEGGAKYQLAGAKAQELTKQANIDGARIRSSGTIITNAKIEGKQFQIAEYQILR